MAATEQDIRNAFDESWRARRQLALAENEHRLAVKMQEIRQRELEQAREVVAHADERLQALAARTAGVDDLVPDSEIPVPRGGNGFRPILR